MRARVTMLAVGMLALAGRASAADAGWSVRVCPKATTAKQVAIAVSVSGARTDVGKYDAESPGKNAFPVTGPLAQLDSLTVQASTTPADKKASLCVYHGTNLVKAAAVSGTSELAVKQSDTDKTCPCKP